MSKAVPKKKLPTISRPRLVELILALQSGELDNASRAEIVRALSWLWGLKILEGGQRTRGRQRDRFQYTAAHYVNALVERHNASVKSAICAVLPDGDGPQRAALERYYQSLKAGPGFPGFVLEEVVQRLIPLVRPARGRNK